MMYNRNKVRKLIDAVHLLVGNNGGLINYTKLIKLLYLADQKALIQWGAPITGDTYYALKNGPVLSKTLDLIKGKADLESQTLWDEYFYTRAYDLVGEKPDRSITLLSPAEIDLLEEIDETYKLYTYSQLIDLVHSPDICPEWSDPGTGSSPIRLEDILLKSGKSQEAVESIVAEYYSNEAEKAFLIEHCY